MASTNKRKIENTSLVFNSICSLPYGSNVYLLNSTCVNDAAATLGIPFDQIPACWAFGLINAFPMSQEYRGKERRSVSIPCNQPTKKALVQRLLSLKLPCPLHKPPSPSHFFGGNLTFAYTRSKSSSLLAFPLGSNPLYHNKNQHHIKKITQKPQLQ